MTVPFVIEQSRPVARTDLGAREPASSGRLTICAGESIVDACMVMGAHMSLRQHEAVLVAPHPDDSLIVRVSVQSSGVVDAEPLLYDVWRDVEAAGRVWSVVAGLLDGRIALPVEEEPFEQLDLLAMEETA